MDESELQRIRAARLAELQSQSSSSGASSRSGPGPGTQASSNGPSSSEVEAQRHAQLSQILTQGARDRLRRIALVKADRAASIEDLILRMAKSGQIRQRVSEAELVELLSEISGRESESAGNKTGGSVIKNLRRNESDDEWD